MTISISGDATTGVTTTAIRTEGIEKLFVSNFENDGGGAGNSVETISTTLMSGLTTVGTSASGIDGHTTFSGLANFVDAEMRNGDQNLTLTYDGSQAVTGTTDSQNLTVSNLTGAAAGGVFTANGIETITVTSETVKSTMKGVASNALKTLVIKGDQDLAISDALVFAATTNGTAVDGTVDGSAATGKLTLDASGSASTVKVTGGTANDTIAMAGTLTKNDLIDGGDGTDTVTMTAATLTTQFAGVSNVETVAFTASTGTQGLDVSKLSAGVTTVQVDHSDSDDTNQTTETFTVTNLDGQTVNIKASTANAGAGASNADVDGATLVITGKSDTAADTVNVRLDAINTEANEKGLQNLNVGNFETVNIESALPATGTVTNEMAILTATSASSLVLTGAADLTLTTISSGALTKLDASGLAAKLVATLSSADKVAVTMGQKDSTVNFGTTLNNEDSVTGGAGTKDIVTASVGGATATTGALSIAGVETVNLLVEANAATINTAGITGATVINVGSAATIATTNATLTNLAAGQKIGLGQAATFESSGKVTATLADATGTEDALTVVVQVNDADDDIDAALVTAGIETVTIDVNASTKDVQLDVASVDAATVNVTGGLAGEELDLTNGGTTKLNKATTLVDASGLKGHLRVDASATSHPGITIKASASTTANTIVGTAKADVFTVVGSTGVQESIDGGAGLDVVNLTLDG
ncbi:MAG: hypothetical protein P8N60_11785, partial [Burkholderiaceae bacterium]|nr:hypothetical protein [Burkholderiaceae bacterium]